MPTSPGPPEDQAGSALAFRVVGVGASAGGLDACRKLVDALPAENGMAFILVQHLDPTHESMMVDLLANHTGMRVVQATHHMPIEPDNLYVIPPGKYLSVGDDALLLSAPSAPHGSRLPFDFLLFGLAEAYGARAACVVLSGTGADGSLGLRAIKAKGGLVIAQDPQEAGFGGMPRCAMETGLVDAVLPAADIAAALMQQDGHVFPPAADGKVARAAAPDWLADMIELLRSRSAHDFTLYKPGTLQRRIARRMAMAALEPEETARYMDVLRADLGELDLLTKDLLINVTSFFRDPKVFEYLAADIVPRLVDGRAADQSLRIWVAGCSSGEETYSLAMLFREHMSAVKCAAKLQLFASDVDADAVAAAREGLYPASITADVSPARLARFFSKEGELFRIVPELRGCVVFTVQDVLADPPFSRLDMVSCRNLLIYLRPEAQSKVIGLFHFALRDGGMLLLGGSETAGNTTDRFEVVSKTARVYKHIGRSRPGELRFSNNAAEGVRMPMLAGKPGVPTRMGGLAALCQSLVMDHYAPAAMLIDSGYRSLYALGPTDRYLRVPPGAPTHDLLAMVRPALRTKLRSAIQQATQANRAITISGGAAADNEDMPFSIAVRPVTHEDEKLLFVCFIDGPAPPDRKTRVAGPRDMPRVAELEQELDATRAELQGAIRGLELANEEHIAINEEALSVNEEFQSTNEELLTSKEEMQSLNEELTALNGQLQETLERQRTTSNDLQNVLFSTDVATLFLDTGLAIRFFNPATRAIFKVIPGDVGRPLADLHLLASDDALLADARGVLRMLTPIEREIAADDGAWFCRRIMPYYTQDNGVEGVVITFTDVTERLRARLALEEARHQAELANSAKSRFLAAASHDLRQPLQTLSLLQGLLAKLVDGDRAKNLVSRLNQTLGAMTGMLNTLLDINQIEAGTLQPALSVFAAADLLTPLRDEFTYHAQAKGLGLRVVPCGLWVQSDPRLLEQMLRNLLSNALKYTERGRVLLGCRRRGNMLSFEIWDSGIGIPAAELKKIFDEYHQLDNAARERSRGLGLGLSIVERLAGLLGHRMRVTSRPGAGSMFAIEVPVADLPPPAVGEAAPAETAAETAKRAAGTLLVVEDDPELRELLAMFLREEGYYVSTAPDGVAALALLAQGGVQPDLILADFNLPGGLDGLQTAAQLRARLHQALPVIVLTGDISTATLRAIAAGNCLQFTKPVALPALSEAIRRLLRERAGQEALPPASGPSNGTSNSGGTAPVVYVIDDEESVRDALRDVLERDGMAVQGYASGEAFLAGFRAGAEACLVVDAYLPGIDGVALLNRLRRDGHALPAIMVTGQSDVTIAVAAMKAGAADFIEKPISRGALLAAVRRALELSRDGGKLAAWRTEAAAQLAGLTAREREILALVLAGHPNKNIAADLALSQRTVENHRAAIMRKTGAASLPALARLAMAADPDPQMTADAPR